MNVGAQQYGIIIFMRGENAMDKKIYKIYRDEILITFIVQTGAEYGEWQFGMPVLEELKAVRSCDGDFSQIDIIINDNCLKIYKENNISANKKNAAISATEQAADIAKVFKIMTAMEKNYSQQYTL